jgi:hypothetical protein
MWRLRAAVLVGALWATLASLVVRRRLKRSGVRTRAPLPLCLGRTAGQGVMAALSRLEATCLERSLVLQAWLVSRGIPRDVVIGVPTDGMKTGPAHAWVDSVDSVPATTHLEMHRLRPRTPAR